MKSIIRLYHLLITVIFRIKRFLRLTALSNCDQRILLFHEVDIADEGRFIAQIDSCSKNWSFIDPSKLNIEADESSPSNTRELILTFDDGFSSDFRLAQNVLNPRGIKALFFVIPEFVDLKTEEDKSLFVSNRLYPGAKPSRIPTHLRSMNWEQISILSRQGHTIGSHSSSHKRLSSISDEEELAREIVRSRQLIEEVIDKKVEHFAFPFGNLSSISLRSLQLARENYKYVYSGLRGSNHEIPPGFVLRRETLHPWDPKGFESAILNGAADSRFRNSLSVLDCWCQEISDKANPQC